MPFQFRNKDRIKNLVQELKEYRYKDIHDIDYFLHYSDDGLVGNRIPQKEVQKVGVGYRFKGYDQYSWFCTNIFIPDEMLKEEVVGLFDFGVPVGTGNNSHFESLLYLNNEP
ncbi:MAG: alpha-mannosidase, partial [Clostridiales bacterium]|nr:alpha-mannosidase [Clostridiales bacterium]